MEAARLIDSDNSSIVPRGEREPAWVWLAANKQPHLLPTPWLSDSGLEDFVERLLYSERLLGSDTRHVQHIERWGVSGDKQDGIDLFGRFNDGTRACWQVKQLKKLSRDDVRAAVRAMTFDEADEVYLVYGGIATAQAREEMLKHPGWTLIDRRTLTEMVRLLPQLTQQDIIEQFWGTHVRRLFVSAAGDALISFDQFRQTRLNPDSLLNDLGELAGRPDEMARLARALDRSNAASPQIIVLSGPGGRGKTRLLVEALSVCLDGASSRIVTCLAPNRVFDATAMKELRPDQGVLVIDDAHNDPPALEPLLAFARSHREMQLVLATRPSGLPAIQGAIARASFGPDEHLLVHVGELTLNSARKLVTGLTTDIKLSFGLRNYLAEQARQSPHVAVILTSLIRKGQISGAIAVNDNLRQVVLARYQEVMIPRGFEGFVMETVHRVIATYACLQPDAQAEDAQERIAKFCGLTRIQLARLTRQLVDRGVVVDDDNRLRVVPDVLADQIVEDVAVAERFDTGFVAELWHTFGPAHYRRLAVTLAELDWRISRRGGPATMAPVWAAIRERLDSPYPSTLLRELDEIAPLAATQPAALVAALEDVRARLDRDDTEHKPEMEDPQNAEDHLYRLVWPSAHTTSRADVRAKLPRLYGQAAVHDPDTLETAVDALLALACVDTRPPHSHPEHARRVLADDLSNLATLPDSTYPARIVARIREFCATHNDRDAVVALGNLKPILAKDELETIQSALYELSFQPHLISATSMRPVRDQIRTLLLEQGTSEHLRRVGVVIKLLREALRPPRAYFGNTVSPEAVLAWENDDLATLSILAHVASRTTFATIRRSIRDAVDWTAEHAESLRLQHAALSLQYELDSSEDIRDALAERIIGSPWKLVGDKLTHLPDMDELKNRRDAHAREQAKLTDEQQNEELQANAHAKIEARHIRAKNADEALAQRLVRAGTTNEIVELLGDLIDETHHLDREASFRGVWQAVGNLRPDLVPDIVRTIAGAERDHPLDQDLSLLISQWDLDTNDDVLSWAADALEEGRLGVRIAIASFLDATPWDGRQDGFTLIWRTGIDDADGQVSSAFLGSSGWYLHADPPQAASIMLAHEIPARAAAQALIGASRFDHDGAPAERDIDDYSALLSIAARSGLDAYIAHEVLSAAARAHPTLALDFVLNHRHRDGALPDDIHGLGPVFDEHSNELWDWVLGHLQEDSGVLGDVVASVMDEQITPNQARSLTARAPRLSPEELTALVRLLGALEFWVPANLGLAVACVERAEACAVLDIVLLELRQGMMRRGWSWAERAELDAARESCLTAAANADSVHIQGELIQVAEWLQQTIERLPRTEREEEW